MVEVCGARALSGAEQGLIMYRSRSSLTMNLECFDSRLAATAFAPFM